MAKWLAHLTSDHEFTGSNPIAGEIQLKCRVLHCDPSILI